MLKKQVIIQRELEILTKNPIILLYHFNNVSTKNWHSIKNKIKQIEEIKGLVIQNKIITKILENIEDTIQSSQGLHTKDVRMKYSIENRGIKSFIEDDGIKSFIEDDGMKHSIEARGILLYTEGVRIQKPLETQRKHNAIAPLTAKSFKLKSSPLELNDCYSSSKIKNSTYNSLVHLFQGPTFVLGCKTKDQLLFIHNLLKKSSNFIFIGSLYNNQNISHHCIEKIANIDDSVKSHLIQFLEYQKSPIFLLKNHFFFTCSILARLLGIYVKKKVIT